MRILRAGPVRRLAFSPDGRWLLTGGTRLWELPEGVEREVPPVHSATFLDADQLACIRRGQQLARYDLRTGVWAEPPAEVHRDYRFYRLLTTPDRSRLAALAWWPASPAPVMWYSCPELRPLDSWNAEDGFPQRAVDAAFTPGGALAILDGRDLHLLDVAAGRRRWVTELRVPQDEGSLACSPDGRHVAAAYGPRLTVFDADVGHAAHELRQPQKYFLGAAFTPDGRFLATVSNEKTVKFFDTSSWTLCHELAWQTGGLRCVAFSPDGMLAAAGGSGAKVVVWDLDL